MLVTAAASTIARRGHATMIDGVSATVEACRCARVCEKEIGGRDTPVTPAIDERATDGSDDTSKGRSEKE